MTDLEKAVKTILELAHQPHSWDEQHFTPMRVSTESGVALRYVHEAFYYAADNGLIELKGWDKAVGAALSYKAYPSMNDFFYGRGDQYVRVMVLIRGLELLQLDKHQPIGFV